eukprot:TRINITY_DN11635_c0_g1_i1.p1 TRINITY_DN11635_c0_g1~~TRINITY_DN11635_c0_g1_i1.p1  ORF type:complete len:319 (-),score=92.95 TRINITY_DN11635_c0_g1_i1:34-966(-)
MELDIDSEPFWQEAHEHAAKYELEEAERVFQEALKEHPNHPRILDALGGIIVQKGEHEKARMIFNLSIKLAPEEGPEKYLNMGQLSSGKEAIGYYKKGISLLYTYKDVQEEEAALVVEQLVSACCSIAEIYMTEECFAEEAEEECGKVLEEALKLDPNNYEALQTMSSYKISQQKPDEALKFLTQSYNAWKDIVDPVDYPEFEFRVQTAKLFMELDDFRKAVNILEALLNEDDEISELWYLLGFALATLDPAYSLDCLKKSRELLVSTNCPEKEIFDQVDEQIARVTAIAAEMQEKGQDVEMEEDEEEDQ